MSNLLTQSALAKFESLSEEDKKNFLQRPGIVWPPTNVSEWSRCQIALGLKTWGDFGDWQPTTPADVKKMLLDFFVQDFGFHSFSEWSGEAYGVEFPKFEVTITSQDILDAWENR